MEALLHFASRVYAFDYFGVLFVLAVLEWVLPRRPAGDTIRVRWLGNAAVAVADALVLRLLFPVAGVLWAALCVDRGWGVLNRAVLPGWIGLIVSIAVLDAFTYAEHYLLHRVPFLWRIHLTHHTDQDVDFTTGLRFHPIESIVATASRMGVIAVAGLPPVGVLVWELLTSAASFWEHANLRVPPRLDRALRLFVVTPEWHRTHHSQDARDNHANFGNLTTCWDRLFGTYRDESVLGNERLVAGVHGFEDRKHLTLPWMLAQPFLTDGSGTADARAALASPPPAGTPTRK